MFRKVKELFGGREESGDQEIRLEDIPDLLASHEMRHEADLRAAATSSRQKILATRERLENAVRGLSDSNKEGEFHPKLQKIVRNSLPQFEKALLLALSRQLPEDADEFYLACSESLKGCVKGLAGPGRYLRNVFPGEMKEIRGLIDEFGKEINLLTPHVAASRARREKFRSLRSAHAHALELQSTLNSLSREIPALEAEIRELERARAMKQEFMDSCTSELASDSAFQEAVSEAERSEKELMDIERELNATFSTFAHVLRKAEKITQRSDAARLARDLKHVIHIVTDHEIPSAGDVAREAGAVLPVVTSMITSGEIQLKNQEERDLFSNPDTIPQTLSARIVQCEHAKENAGRLKAQLAAHPLKARCGIAEHDFASLLAALKGKETEFQGLVEKKKEMQEKIPMIFLQMEEDLSLLIGTKVHIPRE